jgi:hypothetical protein
MRQPSAICVRPVDEACAKAWASLLRGTLTASRLGAGTCIFGGDIQSVLQCVALKPRDLLTANEKWTGLACANLLKSITNAQRMSI